MFQFCVRKFATCVTKYIQTNGNFPSTLCRYFCYMCLDFYVLCMKIYNLCLHFSVLCAKVCYLSADTLLQLRHPNWFRTTGKTVEWLLFGPVFTHIGLDGARVRLFTLARVRNSIFVTLSSHPIGCVTCCQELIIAMARHLLTFNNGPTSPNIQYSANTAHT